MKNLNWTKIEEVLLENQDKTFNHSRSGYLVTCRLTRQMMGRAIQAIESCEETGALTQRGFHIHARTAPSPLASKYLGKTDFNQSPATYQSVAGMLYAIGIIDTDPKYGSMTIADKFLE